MCITKKKDHLLDKLTRIIKTHKEGSTIITQLHRNRNKIEKRTLKANHELYKAFLTLYSSHKSSRQRVNSRLVSGVISAL